MDSKKISRIVRSNFSLFKQLGEVKTEKRKTKGRPLNIYYLNDNQKFFLIMLLKNTKKNKEIKLNYLKKLNRDIK